MSARAAARFVAIIAQLCTDDNNMMMQQQQQQQQQSQPISALRGWGMVGSSPGHRIGGLKTATGSEAPAVIIAIPDENKRLYAPGLLNARVSNDNQETNAEDVVAEHPLPGYIVPVQASADDAEEPLTMEIKGVGALQEGSGGGGGTDVETTMTSTTGFNRNGGTFVAPLGGGSVDSAKTSEADEAFFATGDADTRQQQQHLHQYPPGWTKSFKNVFTKSSGRKLLLVAKDLEKMYAYVEDTTASALIFYASLRFGGRTPALLASLVTGAAAGSVVSAASTSGLSAGKTSADMSDIGSGGTTSVVPGDRTDEATWTLFVCIATILVAMVVASIVRLSPLWVLLNLLVWAESMGRRRGTVAPPAVAPPAVAPPAAAPGHTPRSRRHARPVPPAEAPPAAAPGNGPAMLAAAASTAPDPRPDHVGPPGPPAPANTGPAQPVRNALPAPGPEQRVGRGRGRAMKRVVRGISLASMAVKVKEAAGDFDVGEMFSSVGDFFSNIDLAAVW